MKAVHGGIAVAVLQCAIVLTMFGKYEFDRGRLPRVWAKAVVNDGNLPIRGRYLLLRLEVEAPPEVSAGVGAGHLGVRGGRLWVEPDGAPFLSSAHVRVTRAGASEGGKWVLAEPVAIFLREHAADPSHPPEGKEIWVEVSVPRQGPPRPIRLEVR